ncbi:MAG: GGDEF domain-containing protein [Gammaproteobacteria bacterium]|nr:GGDEF domain-containing protein [Gammaproteobacteria bacterium]
MSNIIDSSITQLALEKLPIATVILQDNKFVMVNQAFADLCPTGKENLLGNSPDQIGDLDLAAMFTSQGSIQKIDVESQTVYLQTELIDLPDQSSMYVFHNVSEKQLLEEHIKQITPKDTVTGLYNKNMILENLSSQVTRSRRYGNPLALLRLTLTTEEDALEERMRSVAEQLKDRLRWADCLGKLDDNSILIILPETCLEEAKELAAKLVNDRSIVSDGCTVQFGITAWQKGDDPSRMLKNTEENQDVSTMALFS